MSQMFRPSLSIAEINYLIKLCDADPSSIESQIVKDKLSKFVIKASVGLISVSHTAKVPNMASALGLNSEPEVNLFYEKWKIAPHLLGPKELEQVEIYRYTNNLMSEEEERTYEAKTFG